MNGPSTIDVACGVPLDLLHEPCLLGMVLTTLPYNRAPHATVRPVVAALTDSRG